MALTLPIHGGDLMAAEARWGKPVAGWLDLSTGINPWPYPVGSLSADVWHRLPGALEDGALRAAAAAAYGCRPDQVLATPGSSAVIQALARSQSPRRVAVVSPTYGEHAAAWALAGHAVSEVSVPADADGADVLVLVNPNNPDGRTHAPADILALTARFALVVVDEAFGEVMPHLSVAGHLRPGLVVLHSFGKFYGLAGLRLGFCLGMPDLLVGLAAQLGPWPVSGPALAIGATALADRVWAEASRAHLAHAAARLDTVLAAAGLRAVGGTSLFRLVEHPDAAGLYDRLGRAGILVRAFAHRPTWLRFGLPGGEAALRRLEQALS
ncbi:Threonine-phosphate decarboxylase [Magnetospirillum gryphiswaldense MSR-1 v2]|uniref:threonine-phosphate decarboxylase n=1 Tax=Magnetospirillum gryphiswaldense (strain DSM 6361 / JCM 21280 / NBRC 15271 / MSR-1) TaxID=431944 RepID=V6EVZ7_MAGGM|nr:threonine-phosphate decarboxylase CobD [Magnetospirillum gryphiswaldense]CDK97354.1 Threonine-phosphate decarboxylase [Magnetospirillum gryphiswaldense MSR-1 v2]